METMSNDPFELSEIDDVRIIISVKDKHYGIVPNKERCKMYEVDAKEVRLSFLAVILQVHDIVTPALEDIKLNSNKDERDTRNSNSNGI
jgi:hypothetical protein